MVFNDFEMIIYRPAFKLILPRNEIDRALYRAYAGAKTVANDGNIEIRQIVQIVWCEVIFDPGNDFKKLYTKAYIK